MITTHTHKKPNSGPNSNKKVFSQLLPRRRLDYIVKCQFNVIRSHRCRCCWCSHISVAERKTKEKQIDNIVKIDKIN
jgi:hypothetical protein